MNQPLNLVVPLRVMARLPSMPDAAAVDVALQHANEGVGALAPSAPQEAPESDGREVPFLALLVSIGDSRTRRRFRTSLNGMRSDSRRDRCGQL